MAKITIPVVTPSLNELLRMHYHQQAKLKKLYKGHIEGAIHDMGMKVEKMERAKKRRLMIYSFRKREIDRDNLWGGSEPLVNAIKELGLIWDDSEKYIDLNILQLKHPEQKTEIFIIDDSKK